MKLPDSPESPNQEQGRDPLKRMNAILEAGQQADEGEAGSPAAGKVFPKRKAVPRGLSVKRPSIRWPKIQWPKIPVKRDRVQAAYWNVTSSLSLLVNVVLIAGLILLSREYFNLKRLVVGNMIGGLYFNFGKMDQAHIRTAIQVDDQLNVSFPLTINQATNVTLTQDTRIDNAKISLSTGGLNIFSAPTDIILPAGTILPVQLNLVVDVNQTVPVNLNVDVDIPLAETELHEPFSNLQTIMEPLVVAFYKGDFYWEQLPACQSLKGLCKWWYR